MDHALEDGMQKRLIAVGVLAVLLGCGKDSTGPGGNPNPDPQRYVIGVNGATFTPDTLRALVGDWIVWEVNSTDAGQHQIDFTNVPPGATTSPTNVLSASQKDSVSFIKTGIYNYQDQIAQTGGVKGEGVLIISPLP
jgi:hypothetical protein